MTEADTFTTDDGEAVEDHRDDQPQTAGPEPAGRSEQQPEQSDEQPERAEAARYRRRLRAAERERDALAEQLGALRRAEVDRLATEAGVTPAGLWASGADVADLLAADGTVDAGRVAEAVEHARVGLGLAQAPRRPRPNPHAGSGDDSAGSRSWADAAADIVAGRGGR